MQSLCTGKHKRENKLKFTEKNWRQYFITHQCEREASDVTSGWVDHVDVDQFSLGRPNTQPADRQPEWQAGRNGGLHWNLCASDHDDLRTVSKSHRHYRKQHWLRSIRPTVHMIAARRRSEPSVSRAAIRDRSHRSQETRQQSPAKEGRQQLVYMIANNAFLSLPTPHTPSTLLYTCGNHSTRRLTEWTALCRSWPRRTMQPRDEIAPAI